MSEPVTPRPAATLLLLRDGRAGLEVLMVARTREVDFAAGALVFPGGRVEAEDAALAPPGDPLGTFRIAAIRESWEECGLLLAAPGAAAAPGPFGTHLAERGLRPAHEALVHFAHWITPAHSPKRFDTHFFLAPAPEGQQAVHDGREAVEALWLPPAAALAEAEAGRRTLVFATRMNLQRLAAHDSVAAALAACSRAPVVTVTPEPVTHADGQVFLRIPEAAGYGGGLFPARDRPAVGGRWPGEKG
ncbi:MAG: NUDIX domain-containing protein [Rubritepida sp.]|nr:NUDIX domain-containing protein [Rubritepida sp.]